MSTRHLGPTESEDGLLERESITESSEAMAMRNGIILKSLMAHLSPDDLKEFRRTNKAWRQNADSELARRDHFMIRLKYHKENKTTREGFYREYRTPEDRNVAVYDHSVNSLCVLNKFIENCPTFPITNVCLHMGNLAVVDAQNFFQLAGHKIKILRLISSPSCDTPQKSPTSKDTFQKIVTTMLPNLESLDVDDGFEYEWTDAEIQKIILPALRKLTVFSSERMRGTLVMLLKSANNLESIGNINLVHTNLLIETDKIKLVKSLDWFQLVADHTLNFASAKPQLKYLRFEPNSRRSEMLPFIEAFNKILEFSKNSMKRLEVYNYRISSDQNIWIPAMTNLEMLKVYDYLDHPGGNIKISWDFPRLHEVFFGVENTEDTLDGEFEPPEGMCVPSAKSFRLFFPTQSQKPVSAHSVGNFCNIFPNVTSVELDGPIGVEGFRTICGEGGWPFLEVLSVQFDASDGNFDSAITGIEDSICEQLYTKLMLRGGRHDYERDSPQRAHPWLGHLQALKHLVIRTRNCAHGRENGGGWGRGRTIPRPIIDAKKQPISCVSERFAFNLLPNLVVDISKTFACYD